MKPIEIDVLGTTYKVYELSPEDEGTLDEDVLGTTDWTTHEIMVKGSIKQRDGKNCLGILEEVYKETVRHEIVHAFLFESGMTGVETWQGNLAENEVIVDWFAMQAPKIFKAFEAAGAL